MIPPRISVIVPVWNRPADIRRCITSLLDQTLPRENYEVIVVDNGSTDDTRAVAASFAGVVVLNEPRPGSYAARNAGLAIARAPLVAFIDSDCTADRAWLANGMTAFQANPKAGIIAGKIELDINSDREKAGICDLYERIFAFNQERLAKSGLAVTANWFSPLDLLEQVGGFRSDLKSGGDIELAKRLRALNLNIVYDKDIIVLHPARSSFSQLAKKARRVVGGQMASQGHRRNVLFWIYRVSLRSAYRIQDILRLRDVRITKKAALITLTFGLLFVSCAEIVLIGIGKKARRA